MALGLHRGDEVVVPSFTFGAAAEAAQMLGLVTVFADIDPCTFQINPETLKAVISPRTKAVVVVHLFGQCADIEAIMVTAQAHNLFVIEDNAQSLGADCFYNNRWVKAGTVGHVGTTSFFPSKNLGCLGDGGALFTHDSSLARRIYMLANHGWQKKYHHEMVGINSRLDTLQAAVLQVKLKHFTKALQARQTAAHRYDLLLGQSDQYTTPVRHAHSTHTFHQYTLRVPQHRDALAAFLKQQGIPTAVYYPIALSDLPVFKHTDRLQTDCINSRQAAAEVLSLPMHTQLTYHEQQYIVACIQDFFTRL
jgi:dTDP-4-amino-4,6-dideoxygalactose transaminase